MKVIMETQFAGLTPSAVYGMFVDHVIRTAEGLRQVAERRERENGPAGLPVADLASLARIPGIQVVH